MSAGRGTGERRRVCGIESDAENRDRVSDIMIKLTLSLLLLHL